MPKLDYKNKWVFDIDNKEFRAGGCCLIHGEGSNMKIMMINSEDKGWEFPGGKVSEEDFTLYNTAIRETVEETNGCIHYKLPEKIENIKIEDIDKISKEELNIALHNSRNLIEEMHNCCDPFIYWIPEYKFKYGLYFVELPESWVHEDKVYGNIEVCEKVKRTISWLSIDQIFNILNDTSVKKCLMLTKNTFLKNRFINWLNFVKENSKKNYRPDGSVLAQWTLRDDYD